MIIKENNEFKNLSSVLFNNNIELFYELQNKTFNFNTYNNQIIINDEDVLLTQEEEKYLIFKLNELKTSIFLDLIQYKENNTFFIELIEDFMNVSEEDYETNIEVLENEIKDYFNTTYSDEDKNKKRMSYENRNKMIRDDLKIIEKELSSLTTLKNNGKLNEKNYQQRIDKLIPIINKINPTIMFMKNCIETIKNNYDCEESKKEVSILELNIKRIREILDIIVKFNIRLVISIVKRYMTKVPNNIEFEDLKNEGIMGLINAIYKFEINTDLKLSTYATWWIKQHIIQFINSNKNVIVIPLYYSQMISDYEKIKLQHEKNGISLTDEQIAEKMGISYKKLQKAIKLIKNTKIVSLNQQNSEDEEFSLEDVISSENNEDEDMGKSLINDEIKSILEKAIEQLNPKEKYIIKERLEIFNENPKTLEELGKKLSRTRERIRQLEVEALKKLKLILKEYGIEG